MSSPVEIALLGCFDEQHERRIVRRLIKAFQKKLAEDTLVLLKEREELLQRITALTEARDFYESQFEQAQARIEPFQARI